MAPPAKRRLQLSGMNKKRLSTGHLNNEINNNSSEEESDMETDDFNDEEPSNFKEKFTIGDIADLFELCRAQCSLKYLSVLLYMSLKRFGVTWNDCDGFLRDIGSLKARTAVEAAPGFFCQVGSAHPIFGSIEKITNTLVIPRPMYSTYICCLPSC
jgi:hypothetical protein